MVVLCPLPNWQSLKSHMRVTVPKRPGDEKHRAKVARAGVTASLKPTGRKRIDAVMLRAVTDAMPTQHESAGDFVRRMRDDNRY